MTYSFLTSSVIALAILGWVLLRERLFLRRDLFRSDIRRIRDSLFDFVWENNLDYGDPAYQRVRLALNGLLRWSNSFSVPMFLVSMWYARYRSSDATPEASDPRLQEKINETVDAAAKRLIKFLFAEGGVGLFLRLCLWAIKLCFGGWRLQQRVKSAALSVLKEAEEFGRPAPLPAHRSLLKHC